MFSNTFYPTPRWLVQDMIRPYKLGDIEAYVLDPSAGKGDILDVIREQGRGGYLHLYAVEIEPELRSILEGKGYPVVGTDFLSYVPRIHFTHIIMNPPFNDAEDHLLHAWDMLYEGEIACLMNATSLEGKTTKERTIRNLLADHGSVENIGAAFANAERPTQAVIALVRLTKRVNHTAKLDFDVTNDREEPSFDDGAGQEVVLNGYVANLLAFFNAALHHYEAYNRTRQDLLRYVKPFGEYYNEQHGKTVNAMDAADQKDTPTERYNTFVSLLQESAWQKILGHPGFQSILTERARNMMKEFRTRQRRVDFNEANIKAMFDALLMKEDEFLTGAVLDAFDTMTKYHKENRIYFEGWKTNDCWKVNRRVVLPNHVEAIEREYDTFHINYSYRDALCDIDRAMCVIGKRPFNAITTIEAALERAWHINNKRPGECESTFFQLRYYKKGTLHLRFLDEALWNEFNLAAARGRNWLPPAPNMN